MQALPIPWSVGLHRLGGQIERDPTHDSCYDTHRLEEAGLRTPGPERIHFAPGHTHSATVARGRLQVRHPADAVSGTPNRVQSQQSACVPHLDLSAHRQLCGFGWRDPVPSRPARGTCQENRGKPRRPEQMRHEIRDRRAGEAADVRCENIQQGQTLQDVDRSHRSEGETGRRGGRKPAFAHARGPILPSPSAVGRRWAAPGQSPARAPARCPAAGPGPRRSRNPAEWPRDTPLRRPRYRPA